MPLTETAVVKMATHIQCQTCRRQSTIEALVVDLDYYDAFDDFNEIPMTCCGDPYPVGQIVSDVPLFPPDDAAHETNADHWHHGNRRYEWELNDDFYDELAL